MAAIVSAWAALNENSPHKIVDQTISMLFFTFAVLLLSLVTSFVYSLFRFFYF